MRTIECVGSWRKLITPNSDVVRHDISVMGQVLVWYGQNAAQAFLTQRLEELPRDIYEAVRLRHLQMPFWVLVGASKATEGADR